MASWEVLNKDDHAALKVSRSCDGARHFAQIVASEFSLAAPYFPILFTKHPETGAFYAGVILGLNPGENLFADNGCLPNYRPADLERQGFFTSEAGIVVDRDHPAFAAADGEPIFSIDGDAAPALKRVQQALYMLEKGVPATDLVIQRFLALDLIEPIDISFDFDDGERTRLEGLYSISLDRLHALPDDVVLRLFRNGDLQLAYAQTGSIRHLRTLGRIRNRSGQGGRL